MVEVRRHVFARIEAPIKFFCRDVSVPLIMLCPEVFNIAATICFQTDQMINDIAAVIADSIFPINCAFDLSSDAPSVLRVAPALSNLGS